MFTWLNDMHWATAIRSDALTPIFKTFSALGYGDFYLIFLPLGYWIINKRIFTRLGLVVLFNSLLNAYLKDFFQDPRPDPLYQLDPAVGESFGFPSGHAQMAVVTWFWLAWEIRKKWVWISSSLLVAGICFSRLYLGVHDVADVIGGFVIGSVLLIFFIHVYRSGILRRHMRSPVRQLMGITGIEAVFFLTWPQGAPPSAVGYGLFLLGFWAGTVLDLKRLQFEKHADFRAVAASGLLGILAFFMLNKMLVGFTNNLESAGVYLLIFQSIFMGAFVTAFAPWIFQRLRLASRQ
ncbi:MAG: phosphatase PAP2 family protein [Desulfobacterales bacterium]